MTQSGSAVRGEPSWRSLDGNTACSYFVPFGILSKVFHPSVRYFITHLKILLHWMVIPSMAWPSGWKQHLLVPQQSARNAKGDKSGHLFIT